MMIPRAAHWNKYQMREFMKIIEAAGVCPTCHQTIPAASPKPKTDVEMKLDMPISEFFAEHPMRNRIVTCLRNDDIMYVGDLFIDSLTQEGNSTYDFVPNGMWRTRSRFAKLLHIPNFGHTCLKAVLDALKASGIPADIRAGDWSRPA